MRLLKIGGSLITDKNTPLTLRYDKLREVCEGIERAYREGGVSFIVGHGAGSFGHITVKSYELHKGVSREEQLPGITKTQLDVRMLNTFFLEECFRRKVPAFTFSPSALLGERFNIEPLKRALKVGVVPIVHGDLVFVGDDVRVMSTEEALKNIALEWGGNVIIGMVEKYGGVYNKNPAIHNDTELIKVVNSSNIEEVLESVSDSEGIDVTGGMRHKVEELYELSRHGIESVVFRGTAENIYRFLTGRKVEGTYFTPE